MLSISNEVQSVSPDSKILRIALGSMTLTPAEQSWKARFRMMESWKPA
jgi:hypothetical protein